MEALVEDDDRTYAARLVSSIGEPIVAAQIVSKHYSDAQILNARHARVRNALMHGNPAGPRIVQTVREISRFKIGASLGFCLDSFTQGVALEEVIRSAKGKSEQDLRDLRSGISFIAMWERDFEK